MNLTASHTQQIVPAPHLLGSLRNKSAYATPCHVKNVVNFSARPTSEVLESSLGRQPTFVSFYKYFWAWNIGLQVLQEQILSDLWYFFGLAYLKEVIGFVLLCSLFLLFKGAMDFNTHFLFLTFWIKCTKTLKAGEVAQ